MKPIEARYSGAPSIDIWELIAGIDKEPTGTLIYVAACALQDHEQRFLQMLKAVETARSPQANADE